MSKTFKLTTIFCAVLFAGLFLGGNEAQAATACSYAGPDGDVTYDNSGIRSTYGYGIQYTSTVFVPTWSESGGQDDIVWYGMESLGGGTFLGQINLANHPGMGNIYAHVYMMDYADGSWDYCDSASFVRSTPPPPPPPPLPTCSAALPDGDVVVGESGLRYTYATGVSGDVTSMIFYAWSESGGQDDIIAWPGQNEGGGRWSFTIPYSSHPGTGTIYVHVYMYTAGYPGGTYCDSANFSRQAPPPPPPSNLVMYANGVTGSTTISYGSSATISWTSSSSHACNVSGNGGTSGSFSTGPLTFETVYHGECFGDGAPAYSNVTVYVNPPPPPTCTAALPDGDTIIGPDGSRYTYTSGVSAGVTAVYFATWTESGGQDDIQWYSAGNEGNGRWSYNIPLNNHLAIGTIQSHAYMYTANHSDVYCDSANFTRLEPELPTVDLRADGSNGPIAIAYGGSATLSWTTTGAPNQCLLNPQVGEGGNVGASGSRSTGALTASSNVYSITCYNAYGNNSDSVTVNVNPPAQPTCASATPDNDWVTTGTRTVTANGVANATSVLFATWTSAGGQDDIIWYPGSQSGATWTVNIPLASHSAAGAGNVHVYMANASYSNVYCDSANYTKYDVGTIDVNSNQSTTWTITCPLSNPACPNVPAGGSATSGSYTGKPQTDWTLTPAEINGYDWRVNSCALNTPCATGF